MGKEIKYRQTTKKNKEYSNEAPFSSSPYSEHMHQNVWYLRYIQ